MKVREIMTQPVRSCGLDTNLATAAMLMWDGDCGILPVVDAQNKVVGLLSDRDICMAVATKHRRAEEISVGEVTAGKVVGASPGDDVHDALSRLQQNRIRRLPVLTDDGKLVGILSMNDLILAAGDLRGRRKPELTAEDIVNSYKGICSHVSHAAA